MMECMTPAQWTEVIELVKYALTGVFFCFAWWMFWRNG